MFTAVRARVLAVVPPLLVLSGCTSTAFRPTGDFTPSRHSPVAPDDVLVLRSTPAEPFVLLGDIDVYVSGLLRNEVIFAKAREKAAAIGANAVVVRGEGVANWPEAYPAHTTTKRVAVRFSAIRVARTPAGSTSRGATAADLALSSSATVGPSPSGGSCVHLEGYLAKDEVRSQLLFASAEATLAGGTRYFQVTGFILTGATGVSTNPGDHSSGLRRGQMCFEPPARPAADSNVYDAIQVVRQAPPILQNRLDPAARKTLEAMTPGSTTPGA